MPCKITYLINSNSKQGWSETYYTASTNLVGANADALAIAGPRSALLADECQIYGWRYSLPLVPGQSGINVVTPGQVLGGFPEDNDVIGPGLQYVMVNGTLKSTRLLRGLPDEFIVWNTPLQRMIATTDVTKPFKRFTDTLIARGVGWPHAGRKNAAGTNTLGIGAISAGSNGQLILTVASTAAYSFSPGSQPSIALSGFSGLAGKLNGTYGGNAWSVGSATQLNLKVQVSGGQINGYTPGTALVRQPNQFANFQTATSITSQGLIHSRKPGRDFGSTPGRRSRKR